MKKLFLVGLDSQREALLKKLRDAGIVHLDLTAEPTEQITELQKKRELFENSLNILPKTEIEDSKDLKKDLDEALKTAEYLEELTRQENTLQEEIISLERDINNSIWGDFDPGEISALKDKGIDIRLYEISREQLEAFPEEANVFILNKTKTLMRVAAVNLNELEELPFQDVPLPESSLSELKNKLSGKISGLNKNQKRLHDLYGKRALMQWGLQQIEEIIEFEDAAANMERDNRITYLTGYVPVRKVNDLKKAASRNGWGLMITDPSEDDMVPTLVENPKFIKPIIPVFKLLGTIPGYQEFDISPWFLLFFSIFWAMIVGDAGYGALFLLFTIIGKLLFRKAPAEPFILLFITSISTIIWGAITGNWFGIETLSKHEAFSWMIVPSISSFASVDAGTGRSIMHLCFFLGGIHLSVAHLLNFIRYLPSLKSLSEVGRMSIIWGLFLLIRTLVLKIEPHPAAFPLLGGGLGAVIIFSEQDGNFIKGVIKGFSNIILIALGSIGFFSDVVSYVRLFAVGLATLEVAKSFNAMAASLGSGVFAVIGAAFVLFFGHTLNIILCTMSLIVHGIRLNMLEFSGHLSMEWSGFQYKPFKRNVE